MKSVRSSRRHGKRRDKFDCFDYNVDTVKIDSQGRFLLVKGKIQDVEYTVVNIYAPNKDACSRKFFENLQRVLSEFGITNEDKVT